MLYDKITQRFLTIYIYIDQNMTYYVRSITLVRFCIVHRSCVDCPARGEVAGAGAALGLNAVDGPAANPVRCVACLGQFSGSSPHSPRNGGTIVDYGLLDGRRFIDRDPRPNIVGIGK